MSWRRRKHRNDLGRVVLHEKNGTIVPEYEEPVVRNLLHPFRKSHRANTKCHLCRVGQDHSDAGPLHDLDGFAHEFAAALWVQNKVCRRHLTDGETLFTHNKNLFADQFFHVAGVAAGRPAPESGNPFDSVDPSWFDPKWEAYHNGQQGNGTVKCCFVGLALGLTYGLPVGGALGTVGGMPGGPLGGAAGFVGGAGAGMAFAGVATRRTFDNSKSFGQNYRAAAHENGQMILRGARGTWHAMKSAGTFCCPCCRRKVEERHVFNGKEYVVYEWHPPQVVRTDVIEFDGVKYVPAD